MRTPEEKLATKLRKVAERQAHHDRVMMNHPPRVRYAKAAFKKGKKHIPKKRQLPKLGVQ